MSFGKNLAKFRKQRGLTQEELVKISGVGISQIRRYEADKSTPSLDAVIKLVKAIGVSIDEMVFDKTTAIATNKIIDRELLEQFELISYMDEDERSLVKKILEGVIVKNQVEKLFKPKPDKSWAQRFREITDRLVQGTKEPSQKDIDKVIDEAVAAVRKKNYARS
jgi:transcriptional regulator with XRE-family HTH domain